MDTKRITLLDVRIALSVLICCAVATALSEAGVKFSVGEMRLDVIQMITACISCLLCCQDDGEKSTKAGLMRVAVTAVGGVVGMGAVALHMLLGSGTWTLLPLVAAGVLATLLACRLFNIPYMNARIGCITFVLVACTLSGPARLWYALFRLVSTVFGAVVVVLVTRVLRSRERLRP